MNKYSELTPADKAKIDFEFDSIAHFGNKDGGHIAACVADNIWKTDGHKCRKVDSDRWSAVLTYLVFSGKLSATPA